MKVCKRVNQTVNVSLQIMKYTHTREGFLSCEHSTARLIMRAYKLSWRLLHRKYEPLYNVFPEATLAACNCKRPRSLYQKVQVTEKIVCYEPTNQQTRVFLVIFVAKVIYANESRVLLSWSNESSEDSTYESTCPWHVVNNFWSLYFHMTLTNLPCPSPDVNDFPTWRLVG